MRWDLFCRVIDNHGDLGVCWRLARDLATRGHGVRLWVDDARALAWMAPQGADGVQVLGWTEAAPDEVGDVVVEAFGCDPPAAFVQAMAQRGVAPVWINLEYLSAEGYVERSHSLPSPTACGLRKWFFYPGFTPRTGGLLREPGLQREQAAFDGTAWRAVHGWASRPGERVVSLFCYALPALDSWLPALADRPTLLLATPGPAVERLRALPLPSTLRVIALPWLTQPDYDRLLWSCDLNAVRGEDSFVRALWSPAPLLWQIYPQHDGAQAAKLEAFLDRYLLGAPDDLAFGVRQVHRRWNGLAPVVAPGLATWPDLVAWTAWHRSQRQRLFDQDDLVTQLCRFVAGKHGPAC